MKVNINYPACAVIFDKLSVTIKINYVFSIYRTTARLYTNMSLLILLLLLLSSFAVADWQHKIYVKSTGVNDTSCWNGTPCATINIALKGVNNSTVVYIYPGTYTLQTGIETEVSGKSHVGIIGIASENDVVISCYPLTGVAFIMSDNIIIESLTIRGCGSLQVFEFHTFQVAVYMLYCYNVHINSTVIESSNGTGLIMYNTVGNVTIQGSVLRENGHESSNKGGGVHIKFSHSVSTDIYSSIGHQFVFCAIINSTFISNNAYSNDKSSGCYNIANQCVSGCESCGVGMSIILRGQVSNNVFLIDTCVMEGNSADHGGGFYIAFHDEVYNNTVNISNSQVYSDMNHDMEQSVKWDDHRGGGGGKIVQSADNNTVNIIDSYISNNTAVIGGGISLICGDSHLNTITIHNTSMVGNKAFTGFALYLASEYNIDMYVEISDSKINNNIL